MQKVYLEKNDKIIPINILEELDIPEMQAGETYEIFTATFHRSSLINYSVMDSWGNVYCILNEEWFSKYFTIVGDIQSVAEYI